MISTGIASIDGMLSIISTLISGLARHIPCLVLLPNTTVNAFLHDAAVMHGSAIDLSSQSVVFMDAVDRERIQRSGKTAAVREREWQTRIRKVMPIIIAAHKHDLPGAADEQAIRSSLGIDGDTPLFFISALKRADTHRVPESMVDLITQFSY